MSNRFFDSMLALATVVAILSLVPVPAAGQAAMAQGSLGGCPPEPAKFHACALEKAKTFNPLRTVDGKPDMQGFWIGDGTDIRGTSPRSIDIEEHHPNPKTVFLRQPGASLIVEPPDGNIPYQSWAAAKKRAMVDKEGGYLYINAVDPHVFCMPNGVPRQIYAPWGFQILQTPGYVVMLFEFSHPYRVISTDAHPHLGENIKLWMGDSRGHWEGNTLVVDVTNQNGKNWLDIAGTFTTDALHVVERWTLIDADTIHYEATIEDPNVFTRPWKMAFSITRMAKKGEGFELMEFACREGERDLQHILPILPGK